MQNNQNYRDWIQSDPQYNKEEAWPSSIFPKAKYHFFKETGCLVTSLAIMLRHFGIEKEEDEEKFNPWILNKRFIEKELFTESADLELNYIDRVYPIEYKGRFPFSFEKLKELYESGQPFLLTVPGVKGERHFIVPDELIDDNLTVIDCAWQKKYLSDFNTICELRKFQRKEA
ncbi:hypothetical protein [Butyrivibrio sp. WCE2006]|uniref:hypothetical protein n=1 Tax=Butyrivibrio sp. WCE2006 TaxID=1410611 RepID=UPI0005D17315|nr:hypothetical protein [Butyrivibrio sp. WCE2006]